MKKCVYLLVVCVLLCVRSAPIDSEMVWLKDVTTSFQTDKRTLIDFDLPDKLTFNLTCRSHTLTLILKRNRRIDPNADIYIVQKLKEGRSLLEKTQNLEKEDLAYYQDRENGAFMTVRCVKISNGHCDRVLNGNIRIGDRNYDLRPAESDVTTRNSLDVLFGPRYVLHDQANIQRELSVKDKDSAKVNEKSVEKERIDQLRRFPHRQEEQNRFHLRNSTLSARNIRDQKDNEKEVYWVEIAVLVDSGIWDLYVSLVETHDVQEKNDRAKRKIRELHSHVINGVNLLYNGIEDPSIEISVTLREIFIFQVFPTQAEYLTWARELRSFKQVIYLSRLAQQHTNLDTTLNAAKRYRSTIDSNAARMLLYGSQSYIHKPLWIPPVHGESQTKEDCTFPVALPDLCHFESRFQT